jgi:hypothetical protein
MKLDNVLLTIGVLGILCTIVSITLAFVVDEWRRGNKLSALLGAWLLTLLLILLTAGYIHYK